MNRKIYFNDKYIEIGNDPGQNSQDQGIKKVLMADKDDLSFVVKEFIDESKKNSFLIGGPDFEKVFQTLKEHFHYIEAAGGFIENDHKQYLLIHRHGRWDLPKGKLDKNESFQNAAIRECEEECGVRGLKILKELSPTFHIYPHKKGMALKRSSWFHMYTDFKGKLIPQTDEDIDRVKWFQKNEIVSEALPDTYYTIADVIREGLGGLK